MVQRSILIVLILFKATFIYSQNAALIPQPQKTAHKDAKDFQIDEHTVVQLNNVDKASVALFLDQLRKTSGFDLPEQDAKDNVLVFEKVEDLNLPNEEGYLIDVTNHKVEVKAKDKKGLFYAAQTLRQLLPLSIEENKEVNDEEWKLPGVQIEDYPSYAWRGYMKDVSRTFYDVEVVKKYLDLMALYKMNTFHWHLTDDQGWRIEIKKYPELTTKLTTEFDESENQPAERSGYYTQEEIKEVVEYAKEREITIVPEIDVPGHSWPTILAYKNLGVNDNTDPHYVFPFVSSWGFWGNQFTPNTLDPTKEEVYDFLGNVFKEIAELFPGEYIHFGGDEVQHKFWEEEEHVQEFMEEKGFDEVTEVQSYFVQRVSSIIEALGKKPLGWNDILADDENLPNETAIMSWLGEEGIKEATSKNFKTVATPYSHVYFDITQENRDDGTPSDLAYPNINSIDRIYNYDPSTGLTEEEQQLVLGIQANMWTALAQDLKDMNVHVFPRLLAIAEVGWTLPEHKNFEGFKTRLEREKERLDLLKVDYYESGGYIVDQWTEKDISDEYEEISFDVTDKIYAEGRAQAGFFYTSGENFLEIDQVVLYENDQVISEDVHHALADDFRGTNKVKPFYYDFEVKEYNPEATYTVKAKVRGVNGTDSKGNFTFNLKPSEPFMVVEK